MTPIEYTFGHCPNQSQPGGCQLHNIQCGYPVCDRRPAVASESKVCLTAADARKLTDEASSRNPDMLAIVGKILQAVEVAAREEKSCLCLEEFGVKYTDLTTFNRKVFKRLAELGYNVTIAGHELTDSGDGSKGWHTANAKYWLQW